MVAVVALDECDGLREDCDVALQDTFYILLGGECAALYTLEIWIYDRLALHAISDVEGAIAVFLAVVELVVVYVRLAHLLSVFFNIWFVSVRGLPAQTIIPSVLMITA